MPILTQADTLSFVCTCHTEEMPILQDTFLFTITYVRYPEPEVANSGSFLLSSNT
jgi:hypothetical protein